jgi:tetraacyldisaccharide 4'-kinase
MNKFHGQNLYFTTILYDDPRHVFGKSEQSTEDADVTITPKSAALLLTGIANTEPLKEHLGGMFSEIIHIPFPDHHNYTQEDLDSVFSHFDSISCPSKYIVTTEKDAVRIMEFTNIAEPYRSAFCYIPIGIGFLNDDREEFEKIVTAYVGKNK